MSSLHFLSLPYDIRYQIYQQLFPPGQQIYIQALRTRLQSITPENTIPTALFRTCKALNAEMGEYLYNGYLFNIIGRKSDCLVRYKDILPVFRKHAREGEELRIDAFSNGVHSSTMCVSIQIGESKLAVLKRRERGEPMAIPDLEREVAMLNHKSRRSSSYSHFVSMMNDLLSRRFVRSDYLYLIGASLILLVAVSLAYIANLF